MKTLLKIVFFLSCLISCQSNDSNSDLNLNHLKYFGFTLIDVGWDDPLDAEPKTNYLDEIADFSNIADLLVINPNDNIISRLNKMESYDIKTVLHLHEIFFEQTGTNSQSGTEYNLRSDYKNRWNIFLETNDLQNNIDKIQAFYIGEEPTWNGISFNELKSATDYVKATIPVIPILMIEASVILHELEIPNSVDWVGFDHYFIKDPKNNSQFLKELSLLKSKLVNENQKLVLVMDTHFIKEIHQGIYGISQNDMEAVADSYYELAKTEEKVIALIGYTWPGGFDTSEALGARQLPEDVKETYIRIGKEIIKKN
ncbi:hypothetical protein UMM65_10255 [Aureibaculum sp. 2210JD6-5]|uniref:hypothetical protein n=1 Tax=Aureibaculum sp. 2210JD6-5 TaxID=3103957 RepID=UPI002AACDB14|nr:hypothetical protein [Aureibaculum sp. 2210JD6-5]MDY7395624.1 hypothetical protein [Aureibaculum sp. 2210JD6-5]